MISIMVLFRRILNNPQFFPLFLVVIAGVLAGRVLFQNGYFNMHDDLQMMRQLEMEKCFKDWQIPCRWVPDMGYGFGFPLFNYYPPLPYLIGQVIRLTGVSFVTTVKLTFFFSIVISGITMYLLAREFWGRLGGMLSAVLYLWAPYHALDIFVRGAMNESWAITWFPLILWSAYKLIKRKNFLWLVTLALSWFALLVSHNIMVMIFVPVFSGWCLLWLWRYRAWPVIPRLIIAGIWAFGLAAFFSIPVLLEQKLVHIETLTVGYYEYVAHFATINQLFFSRYWGYGASVWGEGDKMSFQIGQIHWGLSLAISILLLVRLLIGKKKRLDATLLLMISAFLLIGWLAAFMAHARSTPIWLALPKLAIVQFPWRFVMLATLAFSFVGGSIVILLNGARRWVLMPVICLIVGVIVLNVGYFRPERMGPLTDKEKFSAAAWQLQQTAGIYDYLPRDATIAPQGPRTSAVDIVTGRGEILDVREGTNWLKAKVTIASDSALLRINVFNFAGWKAFVDNNKANIELMDNDELGRMHIMVPSGEHEVRVRLYNTWPRTVGNIVSLLSWLVLLTIPLWRKRLKPVRM